MVGVHPDYSGRGICRALMELCLNHAKHTNEKIVALHTSEFMDAARHIYQSMGFKVIRDLPLRFGKQYWLYTLEIG
jgi:ribosomal protein S18 acetylase RimI-like enzyme